MKMRYLFIAAATILPFAASAVKPTRVCKDGHVLSIPAEFGYDGKASYFFGLEKGNDSETIERINEDLDMVETFTPSVQTLESKVTRWIPSGIKSAYQFTDTGELPASSLSDALNIVQKLYPNGYVTINMRGYYDYAGEYQLILFIPGKTIPEGVYNGMNDYELSLLMEAGKLDNIDGYSMYWEEYNHVTTCVKTEYQTGELDWSTELVEHSSYTTETDFRFFRSVYYYDDMHEVSLPITQTLFNSDEEYEILMPIVSQSNEPISKEVYNGWQSIEYTYQNKYGEEVTEGTSRWIEKTLPILYSGVKVVNIRTGAVVTTFEFTEPIKLSDRNSYILSPDVFVIGNKKYLSVNVDVYDEDGSSYEELYYIFDINGEQSAVKAPVMTKRVSVKPSIVNRGEDVMVNVDGNDAISAITLTGMNGQTLQHIKGNGAKSAAVKTGCLGSGVHIVGVQTTDGANTYNKIVVK